jgi:phosphotransferase system HPr-like phosphotransfer protein
VIKTENIQIKLNDVSKFVNALSSLTDIDFELSRGNRSVDPKSLLGIMGFDLRQPMVLSITGETKRIEEVKALVGEVCQIVYDDTTDNVY